MSTDARHLSHLLEDASKQHPSAIAVEDEYDRTYSYEHLAQIADRVAARLARWGVSRSSPTACRSAISSGSCEVSAKQGHSHVGPRIFAGFTVRFSGLVR